MYSGDAAEQIVRMSLAGVEVAAKITGAGAKELAILIYTMLKNENKNQTKGKARLTGMLKSGKELKVFTVKNEDLKKFQQEAKRYGVLYCVLKDKDNNSPNAIVDVIARAEDSSKINRIVERFNLSSVDKASIVNEAEKSLKDVKAEPKIETPPKDKADEILDEVLLKPIQKEEKIPTNPLPAKTEKSPPSEPSSKKPKNFVEGTTGTDKASVREELRKIKTERKEKEAQAPTLDTSKDVKKQPPSQTTHIQPNNKKRKKSKGR